MLKAIRSSRTIRTILTATAIALAAAAARPAHAEPAPQALVEKARLTLDRLADAKQLSQLKAYIRRGRAVLIVPSQLKGAFIVGVSGGSAVLMAKNYNGVWGYPAFYTIGSGSVGLQAGFQNSEAILVIMNDRALNAILNNQIKLGADVSVAVGPVGEGIGGATTTNVGADIVAFSLTEGLFARGSLEGAGVIRRDDWNAEYYGKGATPRDIIYGDRLSNPGAQRLREALQSLP